MECQFSSGQKLSSMGPTLVYCDAIGESVKYLKSIRNSRSLRDCSIHGKNNMMFTHLNSLTKGYVMGSETAQIGLNL